MIFIIILTIALALLILFAIFVIWGIICNKSLKSTTYHITSEKLPESFDGFRILQISDLHNCSFSKNNNRLISLVKEASPNLIAITGDMIDSRKTNTTVAISLAKELVKIAPCYYVTGNHEARLKEKADKFKEELSEAGVTILDNKTTKITNGNEAILLLGVEDPFHHWAPENYSREGIMRDSLNKITSEKSDKFRILLSHRPELFKIYTEFNIDLALTGHAHGGQIRLPLIGGLFAPCQGFFPKYDSDHHQKSGSHLVVSRGLGNSSFPLRLLNPPEVVIAELKK